MSEETPPSENAELGKIGSRLLQILPLVAIGNMAIAIPTFIISLVLAYFTFQQAEATQKMQVAAVWPYVSYGTSNYDSSGNPRVSLALGNDGAGPARIAGMQVTYKGKAQPNLRDLLLACCSDDRARLGFGESRINGEVLRPGESIAFATLVPEQAGDAVWTEFERERFDLKIEVCYCSVFDECWVRDMGEPGSRSVEQCPAEWTQYQTVPRDPDAKLSLPSD